MSERKVLVRTALLAVVCAALLTACGGKEATPEEQMNALTSSVTCSDGTVRFQIPEDLRDADQLTIRIAGRAEFPDGFSTSLHYLDGTEWAAGETYEFSPADGCTELTMDISLPGADGNIVEKSVDLLSVG